MLRVQNDTCRRILAVLSKHGALSVRELQKHCPRSRGALNMVVLDYCTRVDGLSQEFGDAIETLIWRGEVGFVPAPRGLRLVRLSNEETRDRNRESDRRDQRGTRASAERAGMCSAGTHDG
jgi:hypothetical protein